MSAEWDFRRILAPLITEQMKNQQVGKPPVISSKSISQEPSLYSSVVDGSPVRIVCVPETALKVLQELRTKVYPLVEKDLNTSNDFVRILFLLLYLMTQHYVLTCIWLQLYDAVDDYTKVYVALQGSGTVLGLLIIEQIQPSQIRWIRTIDDLSTLSSNDDSNGRSEESTNGTPTARPSWAGIRVIWVHAQHRRQQWGERMLDCARGNYLFGHVVDKRAIAFSQPTTSGLQFAKKYLRPSIRSVTTDIDGSSTSKETQNGDSSLAFQPSIEACDEIAVPCYV